MQLDPLKNLPTHVVYAIHVIGGSIAAFLIGFVSNWEARLALCLVVVCLAGFVIGAELYYRWRTEHELDEEVFFDFKR